MCIKYYYKAVNYFLNGEINDEKAFEVNARLLALAEINDEPIALWINSGGGSIYGWMVYY